MDEDLKLNDDMLYYLEFAFRIVTKIDDTQIYTKSLNWIDKLTSEICVGVHHKRCRNNYMLRLIICMQFGELEDPFLYDPAEVNITYTKKKIKYGRQKAKKEPWVSLESYFTTEILRGYDSSSVTTGVFSDDKKQMSMSSGGSTSTITSKSTGNQELFPGRASDERRGIIAFYGWLLQRIADEIVGRNMFDSVTVEYLVGNAIMNLKVQNSYGPYLAMSCSKRRKRLLHMIYDQAAARRDEIVEHHKLFEECDRIIQKHSVQPEEKHECPTCMSKEVQDSNLASTKEYSKQLEALDALDNNLKVLTLLLDQKEEMSSQMELTHKQTVNDLNKMSIISEDVPRKTDQDRVQAEEAQTISERAMEICKAVEKRSRLRTEAEKKNREMPQIPLADYFKKFEASETSICGIEAFTEMHVKTMGVEIHDVSTQTEPIEQVDTSILTEKNKQINSIILMNIKGMDSAIKFYENNIKGVRNQFMS